ncbi:phage tail protein [Paenibacillus sp. IB182496]|uniref:Phage tail protein n=1 Tax=Paenibacillus sabuli TaxID=2772509 RepID=A0A927GQC0_9BACL|nr:tail fiber protein [Paenibacillus sabuli]MBD2843602.1 phage tail protein [Paenibacillus sabuli]
MAEPYIGEIRLFGGNFAPVGWMFCEGQLLPISQYDALFVLIGTTYGGDGQTTFALPDYRGRIPLGQGTSPSTGTTYAMGQHGGSEDVTLTANQLPSHTHSVNASTSAGEITSPANAFWSKSPLEQYSSETPLEQMNPQALSNSGGNQSHPNMMPTLTLSYIISLYGIYPSQT